MLNIVTFLESLRNSSNNQVIDVILESVSVIFEGPHVDAARGQRVTMLKNLYTPSDIEANKTDFKNKFSYVPKTYRKKFNRPLTDMRDVEAIDLYMEDEGVLRPDGKIHEPIRYIRDIIDGKLVISPTDDTPIKFSTSDGKVFQKWITSNPMAMMEIKHILSEHPERASILSHDFYDDAIKDGTMKSRFVQELFPAPIGIHESI